MIKTKRIHCPLCKELIAKDAKKCRFCGEWLNVDGGWISSTIPKNKLSRKKRLIIIIIFVVISYLFFNLVKNQDTQLTSGSQNEVSFQRAVERHQELVSQGTAEAARQVYRDYLLPQDRTMSEDEYVEGFVSFFKDKFVKSINYDFKVVGSIGYVDMENTQCLDKNCVNVLHRSRSFRKYHFMNGNWKVDLTEYLCPRDSFYEMEPEFKRALSLIHQRVNDDFYMEFGKTPNKLQDFYGEIFNCLDIKYALNDELSSDVEAFFSFHPGQSTEKMTIRVSPRYQTKDDLITAILLTHEIAHVFRYVFDLYDGTETDCFTDEAKAFSLQNWFFTILNEEEKSSILNRAQLGGSPELINIVRVLNEIPKMRGNTYEEKALNYVKSNPFYQEQCSN